MYKIAFKLPRQIVWLFILTTMLLLAVAIINQPAESNNPSSVYLPLLQGPGMGPCSDSDHDPTEWHPLIDPVKGCHYNHEHKHDPNEVADIFGPAGSWFNGSSLSYPWQTNNENEYKHEAYGWIVRKNIPANNRPVWIKDFRWLVHVIGTPFTDVDGTLHGGYLGRFHSFSLEAQVCNSNGQCGIVRTGGWIDFGNLEIDGIDDCVYLSGDPTQQEACTSLGRRRIHYFYQGNNMPPNKNTFFWYGRHGLINGPLPALHPFQIAVATADSSVNVDPNNLYSLEFLCPEWDCSLNESTKQAHVVGFAVRNSFDTDQDGLADFNGYTDRYGVVVNNCTAPGLDCVPLIIEGAPVGIVQHRDDVDLGLGPGGAQEFDTSPPGEWWIEYPETPANIQPGQLYCVIDDKQMANKNESE